MPVLTSLKEACLRNCSTIIEMELHQSTSGLQYQTNTQKSKRTLISIFIGEIKKVIH
jgi:hypothetical protein